MPPPPTPAPDAPDPGAGPTRRHAGAGGGRPATGPPRVTTVLVGVALVALAVALLAVVSAPVRAEVRATLTRQDAPYVETYFSDVAEVSRCDAGRGRFRADVSVRSHLDEAAQVPVTMTLSAADGRAVTTQQSVATLPGETSRVRLVARKPAAAFTATVVFPGREQRLLLRCAGGSR